MLGHARETRDKDESKKDQSSKVMKGRVMLQPMEHGRRTGGAEFIGPSATMMAPIKRKLIKDKDSPQKKTSALSNPKETADGHERKQLDSHLILNLFNNWWPVVSTQKVAIRFHSGPGNNSDKIAGSIKCRKGTECVPGPLNANIVWTQLICRAMRVTNIFNFAKAPIDAISDLFPESKMDPEWLCQSLINSKLFKITDQKMVVAAFSRGLGKETISTIPNESVVIANHVRGLFYLTRKFLLGKTIVEYCFRVGQDPWKVIPLTFFVTTENFENDMAVLVKSAREVQQKESAGRNSSWDVNQEYIVPMIIKPGEFFNRGKGITIAYNEKELKSLTASLFGTKKKELKAVVQTYLTNPLLFKKRKFDLRCYCLVAKYVDRMVVYWYTEGYARTSSYDYDQNDKSNMMVHLTNEAVQVKGRLF
jgi:hypothetical protein